MAHNRMFATKDVSWTKQKRWVKEEEQLQRAGQGYGTLKHLSLDCTIHLTFRNVCQILDSPEL